MRRRRLRLLLVVAQTETTPFHGRSPPKPTELMATAISPSVTVSMGELMMGIWSSMLRVTLVARLTWRLEGRHGVHVGRHMGR